MRGFLKTACRGLCAFLAIALIGAGVARATDEQKSVDLQLVWDVIENELPALKSEVHRLRSELSWISLKPQDQK